MSKSVLQVAALAAAGLACKPLLAQERRPDIEVYYGDLDLSDPVGIHRLDRRLAGAVAAACPSDDGLREASRLRVIETCRAAKRAEITPLREAALAAAASKANVADPAR
jgi:UrcA family protein